MLSRQSALSIVSSPSTRLNRAIVDRQAAILAMPRRKHVRGRSGICTGTVYAEYPSKAKKNVRSPSIVDVLPCP